MGSVAHGGGPVPFSVTPFFARPFTDNMGFQDRALNAIYLTGIEIVHTVFIRCGLEYLMKNYFGPSMPHVFDMVKNVSFILQNGHATVTYPRPYLPNVAEIACIHCRPAKPLPKVTGDINTIYSYCYVISVTTDGVGLLIGFIALLGNS
jgi:hypothetical protein